MLFGNGLLLRAKRSIIAVHHPTLAFPLVGEVVRVDGFIRFASILTHYPAHLETVPQPHVT
jgi:hypothetical protein